MQPKIVAIHQPNFFPWLGFFSKIARSDNFVFLDHVILNPRSAINTKRVRILSNGQEFWLTVPLKNRSGQVFQKISEMEIDKPDHVKTKHLKTIELNYRRAPFFNETFPFIENFYNNSSSLIADRNIQFVSSILNAMNLNKQLIQSSTLACSESSTELLIEIAQKLNSRAYLSGDGATGYQDIDLYKNSNIALEFMNYVHPQYTQPNVAEFKKGLSILDALMNVGLLGTRSLIQPSQS